MTSDTEMEELRRLSEAATQGPWAARPQKLDDWGVIRTTVAMPDGFRPVVCSARVMDDPTEQDAARAERREPRLTAANTAFIVAAVNYARDRLSAPPAAQDGWRDIATAPKDGAKILLHFPPPFHDAAEDGIVTGVWTGRGWFLSAIWASTSPHREPDGWLPLPAPSSAYPPGEDDNGTQPGTGTARTGRCCAAGS